MRVQTTIGERKRPIRANVSRIGSEVTIDDFEAYIKGEWRSVWPTDAAKRAEINDRLIAAYDRAMEDDGDSGPWYDGWNVG